MRKLALGAALSFGLALGPATSGVLVRAQEKPAPAPDAEGADKAGPPRTDDAVHRVLDGTKVTREIKDAGFVDALDFLHDEHHVNFALDSAIDATKPVSISLKDVTLKDACDQLAKKIGCVAEVWEGVVFFTSLKSPKKFPPKPDLLPRTQEIAEKHRVSIDFVQVDLDAVSKALAEQTKIAFTAGKDASATVTCRLQGVTLEVALAVIARTSDLRLDKKGDAQVWNPRK